MGEIYEAVQEHLQRRVAVKVIRRGRVSPEARDRFLREQRVLARLHQTHIVPIHVAGEEGRLQYFVMPYIEGAALHHVVRTARELETAESGSKTPTLAQLAGLAADSRMPAGEPPAEAAAGDAGAPGPTEIHPGRPSENDRGDEPDAPSSPTPVETSTRPLRLSREYLRSVAQVMADAAEAVQHAHDDGVLHRDLKPSNIMVDQGGQCWIIDFGLARYLEGRPETATNGAGGQPGPEPVTGSGVLGTPEYMAPEQLQGKADARTDVWGLGVTLYELLTLRRAFEASTAAELCEKILSQAPTPPQALVQHLPPDLAAVCLKALQKEPGQRYWTAWDFAADLRHWLGGEPTVARPLWPWQRAWLWAKRSPWQAAAVTFGLLAISTGIVAVILTLRASASASDARAAQAQAEAQERNYEVHLLQMQRTRFGLPIRWSRERLRMVEEHYKGRPDSAKRKGNDEAAAALAGLDAVVQKELQRDAGSLAFSRDGKRLLLGGSPSLGIRAVTGGFYDRETDEFAASEQPGDGPVAFGEDGTPLQLVATDAYTLLLWDVNGKRKVREFHLAPTLPKTELKADNQPRMALSIHGSLVAASTMLPGDKPTLVVWETATGNERLRSAEKVEALALTPDGTLLATGDEAGAVAVRPLKDPNAVVQLPSGHVRINCLAFARDPLRRETDGRDAGWLLAVGDFGGGVTVWDVRRQVQRSVCLGSHYDINGLAFSPDGTLLASVGREAPHVWDVATGRLLLTLKWKNTFTDVAFSPDGKFLAVSAINHGHPGGVEVYAFEYGRGVQTLRGLRGQVEKTCLSPDGRTLAALSNDWQVGVWDLETGRLLRVFEAPGGLWSDNGAIALSDDGRLACASWRKAVWWNLKTGEELGRRVLPPGLVNMLGFHPSGKLLLFRMETEDGKHAPDSSAPPKDHPRVQRIRDLLAKDPKPLVELRDLNWHIYHSACPPDGSYFLVDGLRGPRDAMEHRFIAYDGLTGKRLWNLKEEPWTGGGGYQYLDPTGKLLAFSFPGQGTRTLVEMPTGVARGSHPLMVAFSPKADWWLNNSPGDSSEQSFGYRLHRRGEEDAVVTLGTDNLNAGGQRFTPTGTHVLWGNADGTVTVCDIPEIQRRLAAVGLGW
jgi:serine/threonine protein kinase/WD40 repeat protein